ncbi:hypothetical protein GCM10023079_54110 [Streptomyces chitinivorans]
MAENLWVPVMRVVPDTRNWSRTRNTDMGEENLFRSLASQSRISRAGHGAERGCAGFLSSALATVALLAAGTYEDKSVTYYPDSLISGATGLRVPVRAARGRPGRRGAY